MSELLIDWRASSFRCGSESSSSCELRRAAILAGSSSVVGILAIKLLSDLERVPMDTLRRWADVMDSLRFIDEGDPGLC